MNELLEQFKESGFATNFQSIIIILSLCGIGIEFVPIIKINPISALLSYLGNAINKDLNKNIDCLHKNIEDISKGLADTKIEIENLKDDMEKSKILSHRYRVLRFGDELIHGQKKTKEHFDQILICITEYENYCSQHNDFKNNVMASTEKYIFDEYDRCLKEDDFLK